MTKTRDGKAFDTSYTSAPTFYPDEVRIIGGADLTDKRQRGLNDVSAKDVWKKDDAGRDVFFAKHPLYNKFRLAQGVKTSMVKTIDLVGIVVNPTIVKLNDVATVQAGTGRVRGARIVNYDRKKACGLAGKNDREAAEACALKGHGLIKLECKMLRVLSDADLVSRMAVENHHRQQDNLATTIELAMKLIDGTGDYATTALLLDVDVQTVRAYVSFYDHATDAVKQACLDGKLEVSAGAILSRERDPAKQDALLAELLSGKHRPTVRNAARLVRKDKGSGANPFRAKGDLLKFRTFIGEQKRKTPFEEALDALLELMTTGSTANKQLAKYYKAFEG